MTAYLLLRRRDAAYHHTLIASSKIMIVPRIKGIIERRILINYSIDKDVIQNILPEPFKPKLVGGRGVAGICLIRLSKIRPTFMPKLFGFKSENGAHRIAVRWTHNGIEKEGVYIPRRDTSSIINSLAGGFIFPGIHHISNFKTNERNGKFQVEFKNRDGTYLNINASKTQDWNENSVFTNVTVASEFLRKGSIGYSPSSNGFHGLKLKIKNWHTSSLSVASVESSYFDDKNIFPLGSIIFDNALLMENINHEWIGLNEINI